MNKYKIVYGFDDGLECEEIVMAVNRVMALEMFNEMYKGSNDIVYVNCYRMIPEDEDC